MNCVFLVWILFASFVSRSSGMFNPEHPQTAFCKAEFVIRVKILSGRLLDVEIPTYKPQATDEPATQTSEEIIDEFESGEETTDPPLTQYTTSFGEEELSTSSSYPKTVQSSTQPPFPVSEPVDEQPSEELTTANSSPQDFQKPTDFPPGVLDEADQESEDSPSKRTDSYKSGFVDRYKRSLSFGLRGVPPPPSEIRKHQPNPYRKIGGHRRDKTMFFYDVLIKKVFKGGDRIGKTDGAFKDASDPRRNRMFARIYVSSHNGHDLERRGSYLLAGRFSGNKLEMPNGAWWQEKWEHLTEDEITGIRGQYAENCKCEIKCCIPGYNCPPKMQGSKSHNCNWELRNFAKPRHDCGARHQVCKVYQGSCQWEMGKGYDNCLNSPGMP